MSLNPWKIGKRLDSPDGNLHLETWSSDSEPVGWEANNASLLAATYSGAAPVPWDGAACMRVYKNITSSADGVWELVDYTVPAAHHPELYDDNAHTLRASIRCGLIWYTTAGTRLLAFTGSSAPGYSNAIVATPSVGLAGDFGDRFVNSWQLLETTEIAWTGSAQITLRLAGAIGTIGYHWLAVDDLRLIFDEIEVYQHPQQSSEVEPRRETQRSESGRVYGVQTGQSRRWSIPAEFVSSGDWQRFRDWQREDAPLWLTTPDGVTYPVISVAKEDSLNRLHDATVDERYGTIELVTDYSEALNGPVHGEALP